MNPIASIGKADTDLDIGRATIDRQSSTIGTSAMSLLVRVQMERRESLMLQEWEVDYRYRNVSVFWTVLPCPLWKRPTEREKIKETVSGREKKEKQSCHVSMVEHTEKSNCSIRSQSVVRR